MNRVPDSVVAMILAKVLEGGDVEAGMLASMCPLFNEAFHYLDVMPHSMFLLPSIAYTTSFLVTVLWFATMLESR